MTEYDFVTEMKRLEGAFGASAFNFEKLSRIKNYVMHLPAYNFKRVVDHLIDNHKTAPLPKDFAEAARAERSHAQPTDPGTEKKCRHCDGDGYVSIIQEIDGRPYSYSYACSDDHCLARHKVPPNYPRAPKNYLSAVP
jgi:hypothetical protein